MSDLYEELLVKRKKKASDSALKALMIAAIVISVFAGLFIHPFALLAAIGFGILAYFTQRSTVIWNTSISIVNGELDVDKIMSQDEAQTRWQF